MVPDRDRDLQDALTCLTAAVSTVRRDLAGGRLAREACVQLALVLLDGADRLLQRLIEGGEHDGHGAGLGSADRPAARR